MQVKFKNSEVFFDCSEPIEQKLFKSGVPSGWMVMFHIKGELNSSELDEILTSESISKMVFTASEEKTFELHGYSTVTACVIRYRMTETIVELQFTKPTETKESTEGVKEIA